MVETSRHRSWPFPSGRCIMAWPCSSISRMRRPISPHRGTKWQKHSTTGLTRQRPV